MAMVIARVLTEVVNIRSVGVVGNESILSTVVLFLVAILFILVRDIGFDIEKLVARRPTGALSLRLYNLRH
jgi:hypothetical protein